MVAVPFRGHGAPTLGQVRIARLTFAVKRNALAAGTIGTLAIP
jgi:hypothetical protein